MKRREFLMSAAAVAGAARVGQGQGQGQAQGRAGGPAAPGRAGGPGRGGGPANVPAAKLERIAIMSLNHGSMLKLPWNASPTPAQTLDLMDLPQYYVDVYGVKNIEFQHGHLAENQDAPDPEIFRAMKAKLDATGSRANQINIEIGTMATMSPEGRASALSGDVRAAWIARGKKWIDIAPMIGIKRLMLNQGSLNDDSKAGVTAMWKELQDYAKPKGILMSNETRGNGAPTPPVARGAAPPASPPPPAPAMSETERMRYVWGILTECAEGAGAYTNLDFGGAGRFRTQQQINDAIRGMMKTNAGSMHLKSSPDWDIGLAVRFAESIGYKGLYTIEVNPDTAVRIVYNTILANLA
jgi:hypothetical protein